MSIPFLMYIGFVALSLMFGSGLAMVRKTKEIHTQWIGASLLVITMIIYFSVLPFLYDITVDK